MPDSPDILWIQCDEVRADAFSCYRDNPWVQPTTPNVQRIADQGVVFENAFCPSPVCMPSRGSEFTSQHPTTLGVYHNVTPRLRDTLEVDTSWLTWTQVLREAGYRAVNVGKSHTVQYDIWDESAGCRQYPNPAELIEDRRDELDLAVVPGINLIVGGTYPLDDGDYESFGPRQLTRMALDKLRELQGAAGPWLLRVSYVAPHTPVLAPPPFDTMYPESTFAFDSERDRPHEGMSRHERSVTEIQQSQAMSRHEIARARATYYGLQSAIDREIGLLMDGLDASDRPVIVLITGDHAAMQGEMGLWQKQVFNRKVHQIPFVIRAPGLRPGPRADNADLLDTGPTLLSMCGLPVPDTFVGRNLFADRLPSKDIFAAFGFGDPGAYMYEALRLGPGCPQRICIRSGPYRLDLSIRHNGQRLDGDAQDVFLCDTARDPEERHNAAHEPRYASIVSQLRTRLLTWYERSAGGTA